MDRRRRGHSSSLDRKRPSNRGQHDSDEDSRDSRDRRDDRKRRRRSRSNSRDRGQGKHIRPDAELFIGNIDTKVPEEVLKDYLNQAMKESGLVSINAPDPIISCKISNRYGFLQFTNVDDCTKALNLNGIPFQGSMLKVCRTSKYTGPFTPSITWQELTATDPLPKSTIFARSAMPTMAPNPNGFQTDGHPKVLRELYVGGVSSDMPDEQVIEFLGGIMQKFGLSNSGLDNPVLDVRNSGKFAFVTMKTVEDAANLLNFNGIVCYGQRLKVERPGRFDSGRSDIVYYNWDDLIRLWKSGDLKLLTAGAPSRIVKIINIASADEMLDNIFYVNLLDDLRSQAAQYGIVHSISIPRPTYHEPSGEFDPDVGKVFIEMDSEEDAKRLLMDFKDKSFNGRQFDVRFYPEEFYHRFDYGLESQRTVLTASHGVVLKSNVLVPQALL